MQIADAQRQVRQTYRGGLAGQLVSGVLWAGSAAIGTWGSHRLAAIVLVLSGFLIFPLTVAALRLAGRRALGMLDNPLNALAMQVAFTVPFVLPVVLTLAYYSPNRFFPAILMVVGAHYLPFVFLYGMRMWWFLAGLMLGTGYVLGWVKPMGFATGGWVGALLLVVFAFIGWRVVIGEERRTAS